MLAQWQGEPSGPDEITMHGFTFERKGDPVEIPDDHPAATKFVNNQFFKVQVTKAPDAADESDPAPKKGGRPRKVAETDPDAADDAAET